jgi:hypothetical protein
MTAGTGWGGSWKLSDPAAISSYVRNGRSNPARIEGGGIEGGGIEGGGATKTGSKTERS